MRVFVLKNERFLTANTYRSKFNKPDTLHLYAYCANNPINYIDPSGHKYNRSKAVNYALNWATAYNSKYRRMPSDCANFVSQCVHAGGKSMTKYNGKDRNKGWNYTSYYKFTYTWSLVSKQYAYFKNHWQRGKVISITTGKALKSVLKSPSHKGIKKGDIAYFSSNNKGLKDISHASVVTTINNKEMCYSAHQTPKKDEDIESYITKYKYNVYVLKIR